MFLNGGFWCVVSRTFFHIMYLEIGCWPRQSKILSKTELIGTDGWTFNWCMGQVLSFLINIMWAVVNFVFLCRNLSFSLHSWNSRTDRNRWLDSQLMYGLVSWKGLSFLINIMQAVVNFVFLCGNLFFFIVRITKKLETATLKYWSLKWHLMLNL